MSRQTLAATLIIPSHNRKRYLELTLATLRHQSVPASEYEVILVDDGSTDGTQARLESLELPANVRVITQSNQGRSRSRNNAARLALGEILIFSDAECLLDPDFIQTHLRWHADYPDAHINGWTGICQTFLHSSDKPDKLARFPRFNQAAPPLPPVGSEPVALVTYAELLASFEACRPLIDPSRNRRFYSILEQFGPNVSATSAIPWFVCHSANESVRLTTFERLGGGFDESLGAFEDWELSYRFAQGGATCLNVAAACNYHQEHPLDRIADRPRHFENFQRFYRKHPTIEVLFVWAYWERLLEYDEWNDLMAAWPSITDPRTARIAARVLEHALLDRYQLR